MASSVAWTLPKASDPGWAVTVVKADAHAASQLADLPDRDLVERSLAGHSGAFDVIVERHRRSVYQLCYRFVGNHEDASDLSQDVFLRAFRGLRNFKGQATVSTWLYRIGVNVCLNRLALKTPKSESIDNHEHVDVKTESPSERVLRDERAVQVRQAIAQLPAKQKAALILRMYHDMSHQEIADTLGSSVGAVKANVFHALQNLKKLLREGAA